MKHTRQLTAIIEREGDGYVGLCPELDIASQGETIEGARANLQEAVELFSRRLTRLRLNDGVTPRYL
jgi:predicted RNase H-like HicB family nuclease